MAFECTKWNYIELFAFLILISVYIVVILIQKPPHESYLMTSTIKGALFTVATDTAETCSSDIAKSVNTPADITGWLSTSVASGVFRDPVCGNGVCEEPQEFKAMQLGDDVSTVNGVATTTNRWIGCQSDCGRYYTTQLTPLTFSIQGNFVSVTENLGHSFNICRKGEPVCWFKTYQRFTQTTALSPNLNGTINVLDGPWYIDIKDSTDSGGTSGTVVTTRSVVNTTYDYYPTINSSYSVSTTVANWSACVPGTPKSSITASTAPQRLVFTIRFQMDPSHLGYLSDAQMASIKTQLATLYGVSADLIAIVVHAQPFCPKTTHPLSLGRSPAPLLSPSPHFDHPANLDRRWSPKRKY